MAEEWITWEQAAELVGCPVPTIDWHKRLGRIRSRRGRQPSLERASVEEFALWWRERARIRADRPRRRTASSRLDSLEWATSREAGEALGVSAGQVGWLCRHGALVGEVQGGRLWVDRESLRVVKAERAPLPDGRAAWVSYAEAARIIGCPVSRIAAAVKAGQVEQRSQTATALPSLRRPSVERFAETWRAEQRAAAERRARAQSLGSLAPPVDGEVWLDTATAAAVLGVTPVWVRDLAHRERLPHQRRGTRLWFRRDHVEQAAAARAFAARRSESRFPARIDTPGGLLLLST